MSAGRAPVLVTGGAGFVGSAVCEVLVSRGERVVVIDDLSTGHRRAVPPEADLVVGSIGCRDTVEQALSAGRPRAVIHLAARALIDESVRDPASFFRANVVEALHLLDLIIEQPPETFVFSSTAAVYGEPRTSPLTEDHPTAPINAYGESKLAFERALRWYSHAYGFRAFAFRYFNAAGATEERGEDHRPETHLLPRLLAAAETGSRVPLYGDDYDTEDGTCVRDFVHIADLAHAHVQALDGDQPIGFHPFNLGLGRGISVRAAVEEVEATTGKSIDIEILPRRPGDPARLVASAARARDELGWLPRFGDFRSILESAWRWRQRNPDGYGSD